MDSNKDLAHNLPASSLPLPTRHGESQNKPQVLEVDKQTAHSTARSVTSRATGYSESELMQIERDMRLEGKSEEEIRTYFQTIAKGS